MSLFILIFCLSIVFTSPISAQWRRLLAKKTFSVAANPQNPRTIYVGGIGRVIYRSFDGGNNWDTLVVKYQNSTSVITNIFIHPVDTNIIIVGGIRLGTLIRSTDGGMHWEDVLKLPYNLILAGETLIGDVNNSEVIYAADLNSSSIFRSTNRGASWVQISTINNEVCTLTMLPNSTTIFAGCLGGFIYRSTDSGHTWQQITLLMTTFNFEAEIPRIIFSHRHPLIGYAAVTIFNKDSKPRGGIYKTIDGGNSWYLSGFADTSIWSLALCTKGELDELFIGGYTENFSRKPYLPGQGIVSLTRDGGITWERTDNSIKWTDTIYRNVWMMKFFDNKLSSSNHLYMATEAGFFVRDSPNSTYNSINQLSDGLMKCTAMLKNGKLIVKLPDHISPISGLKIQLYTLLGEKILDENLNNTFEFPVMYLQSSIYICQFISERTQQQLLLISQ